MRIYPSLLLLTLFILPAIGFSQDGYVINRPKEIKVEHAPKPHDFKTKELSWGAIDSDCLKEKVTHGTWFYFYPLLTKLKVTVSTGFNWGDLVDPYVYIGYLDTIDGLEVLVEAGCEQFKGAQGDFTMEVYNLVAQRKHFLLIGSDAKKLKFALYLTQRFESEDPPPPPIKANTEEKPDAKPSATVKQRVSEDSRAVIIGRIRNENGTIEQGFDVKLMNDDLEQTAHVSTDEYGQFRFENVNADKINLLKLGSDEEGVIVDMFLYDEDGNVIGKPISLGHRMLSFRARKDYFNELAILSERDLVVDVVQGSSSMTGRVVDKETYLVGREGVKVGLYSDNRSLIRSTSTDMNGRFSFEDLEDREYIVKVEHKVEKDFVEIVLADDLNVPYAFSNSNQTDAEGYFKFKKLPKDIVELKRMEVIEDSGMPMPKTLITKESEGKSIEIKSIEFATASSVLREQVNAELDQLALELKLQKDIKIKIDGHTDNVGSTEDNLKLSNDRAEAVKAYLISKGVAGQRITCEGFGPNKPLVSNDTEEGRKQNRRVEFTVYH